MSIRTMRLPDKKDFNCEADTSVDRSKLLEIAEKMNTLPGNLMFFSKVNAHIVRS